MTLFDTGGKTPQSSPQTTLEEGKYREALVGDGKKFRDDEALAKGKWESDQYIARLEAETEQLRSELNTRLSIEEALAKIQKSEPPQAPPSNTGNNPSETSENQKPQITQEQLEALLDKKLNQRQEKSRAERNLEQVKQELSKAWGPSAQSQLRQKIQELGLSEDEANTLAARNPMFFLKSVGAETKTAPVSVAPPRSEVAPHVASGGPSGRKTWKHYQNLLQTDPKTYHSVATQQEIYKAAMEMGQDFYK